MIAFKDMKTMTCGVKSRSIRVGIFADFRFKVLCVLHPAKASQLIAGERGPAGEQSSQSTGGNGGAKTNPTKPDLLPGLVCCKSEETQNIHFSMAVSTTIVLCLFFGAFSAAQDFKWKTHLAQSRSGAQRPNQHPPGVFCVVCFFQSSFRNED